MKIVAIVLTYNEELHLDRCLSSLKEIATNVVVVDSFSTDLTINIAHAHGAQLLQHEWVNHSVQFNWALQNIDSDTDWVFRLDADEYLTPLLINEIRSSLIHQPPNIDGIFCIRRISFQGRLLKYGGVGSIPVLRIFRYGRGFCENRWMDEHIKVSGNTSTFNGEIIDDNLNNLTWWTNKHNNYASREAVDLLNIKYNFAVHDTIAKLQGGSKSAVKRWVKERIYAQSPLGFRSLLYFIYRYFILFGFLDGAAGTSFHFLQGFWYRYLVDAKVSEVERYIHKNNCGIDLAISRILKIKVTPSEPF